MQTVWRPITRPELGFANSISERIRTEEWRCPGLLTAVNRGPTLLVVSDYAGEHATLRFQALSFLLVDLRYISYWNDVRLALRRSVLRDKRRLAYKKLGSDERRAGALVPFLRAANSIPGLLLTFLIDKRIDTLFQQHDMDAASDNPVVPENWNRKSFEKLLRVAHLSALLVSGLVGEGQNVLWVSDRDEIVPNDARHIEACKLFGQVLSGYLNCDIGRLQFATTRSDDGSLQLEDIAALPDFAAGSLAEICTSMAENNLLAANEMLTPMSRDIPKKAQAITGWLAENTYPLKKVAFVIDWVPPDSLKVKLLLMRVVNPISEYNFVPELHPHFGGRSWPLGGWS